MRNKESEMGKVKVELTISNLQDEGLVEAGVLPVERVRRVRISALVDTGATLLVLPESVIARLGLPAIRQVSARLADGRVVARSVFGGAKLEVLGRVVTTDVLSAPEGVRPLLGQIPLEGLDFLVDARGQRLIPNPEAPDPDMALVDVLLYTCRYVRRGGLDDAGYGSFEYGAKP